jgi:RNA polymerase sigma-70 factor (ECF subfamily)
VSETRETRFDRLLREHGAGLARLAGAYAQNPSDREDLLQEILLGLWLALPRFRGDCSERTFAYRIAHNCGITLLRRRRPPAMPLEKAHEVLDPRPDPETEAVASEAPEQLAAAVRALPETLRSVVVLHLEDLDPDEIAQVLGLTRNNVAVRLTRARHALRDRLHPRGRSP